MFGLSALEERACWLALIVLVILGFAWHERHVQALKDRAADERVAAAQEAATKAQEARDATLMTEAEKSYHDEIDRLSASTVPTIVCHTASTSRLPKASGHPDRTPDPAPAAGVLPKEPERDIGRPLYALAGQADRLSAQLRALQLACHGS